MDYSSSSNVIKYQIPYIDVSTHEAEVYLYRKQNTFQFDCYRQACRTNYEIKLYPITIDVSTGNYRQVFIELSQLILSIRIQRVILQTSIQDIENKINQLNLLKQECYDKYMNYYDRIVHLENEVLHISPSISYPSHLETSSQILYTLLSSPRMREVLIEIFHSKECVDNTHAVLYLFHRMKDNNTENTDYTTTTTTTEQSDHLLSADDAEYTMSPEMITMIIQLIQCWEPCRMYLQECKNLSIVTTLDDNPQNTTITTTEYSEYSNNNMEHIEKQPVISTSLVTAAFNQLSTIFITTMNNLLRTSSDTDTSTGISPPSPTFSPSITGTQEIYDVYHELIHMITTKRITSQSSQKLSSSRLNSYRQASGSRSGTRTPNYNRRSITPTSNHIRTTQSSSSDQNDTYPIQTPTPATMEDYISMIELLMTTILYYIDYYALNTYIRPNTLYMKTLELYRTTRIKKLNHKLIIKGDYELEVDPSNHEMDKWILMDEYIDTSIIHNIEQRMKYYAALPMVTHKISILETQLHVLYSELAALVQYGYTLVAPHIQRLVRGKMIRRCVPFWKVAKRLKYLWKRHFASLRIQCIWRRKLAYMKIPALRAYKTHKIQVYNAILIQKMIRGWIQRCKYKRLLHYLYIQKINAAALLIQTQYRGYRERIKFKVIWETYQAWKFLQLQISSSIKIQRVFRGYFIRKYNVRSYKIRQRLQPEILHLAEHYLKQGDLWKFLCDVNDEITRLKTVMEEKEVLEEETASTFVKHVLKERQNQFDNVWNEFSQEVQQVESERYKRRKQQVMTSAPVFASSASSGMKMNNNTDMMYLSALSSSTRGKNTNNIGPMEESTLYTADMSTKKKSNRNKQSSRQTLPDIHEAGMSSPKLKPSPTQRLNHSLLLSPEDESALPPGAFMRRVITNTVKRQVDQYVDTMNKVKPADSRLRRMQNIYKEEDIIQANTGTSTSTTMKKEKKKKRGIPPNKGIIGRETKLVTVSTDKSTPHTTSGGSASHIENKLAHKTSAMDWLTTAAFDSQISITAADNTNSTNTTTTTTTTIASNNMTSKATESSIPIVSSIVWTDETRSLYGGSLLLDIPNGLDASINHLLRAAALRCYIPEFFQQSQQISDVDAATTTTTTTTTKNTSSSRASPTAAAYQIYLQLPFSLAKIKYEQEAWAWADMYIQKLTEIGVHSIQDLLPFEKGYELLSKLQLPLSLLDMCMFILMDLQKMNTFMKGGHVMDAYKLFHHTDGVHVPLSQKGTAENESESNISLSSFQQWLLKSGHYDVFQDQQHYEYKNNLRNTGMSSQSRTNNKKLNKKGSDYSKSIHPHNKTNTSNTHENKVKLLEILNELDRDPVTASTVLCTLIEPGNWMEGESTIHELIHHTFFLLCPEQLSTPASTTTTTTTITNSTLPSTTSITTSLSSMTQSLSSSPTSKKEEILSQLKKCLYTNPNQWNHHHFITYLHHLDSLLSVEEKRLYTKYRYYRCRPYSQLLIQYYESMNITTIYDLISTEDEDFIDLYEILPPNVRYQLSAFITMSVQYLQENMLKESQHAMTIQKTQMINDLLGDSENDTNGKKEIQERSTTIIPIHSQKARAYKKSLKQSHNKETSTALTIIQPPETENTIVSVSDASLVTTMPQFEAETYANAPNDIQEGMNSTNRIITYDPRYQRSPYDPFGKPRPTKPHKKLKPITNTTMKIHGNNKGKTDSLLPGGLWETPAPADMSIDELEESSNDDANTGIHTSNIPLNMKNNTAILFHTRADMYSGPSYTNTVDRDTDTNSPLRGGIHVYTSDRRSENVPHTQPTRTIESAIPFGDKKKKSRSSSLPTLEAINIGNTHNSTLDMINATKKEKEFQIESSIHKMQYHTHEFVQQVRKLDKLDNTHKYMCQYPGCEQSFSRLFTLSVHMKSHQYCQGYHNYKKSPQLFLDCSAERDLDNTLYQIQHNNMS